MEQSQTLHPDADDRDNAVSNPSFLPGVTSSSHASELQIDSKPRTVDHPVLEGTVNIDAAQVMPPIIHTDVNSQFRYLCLHCIHCSFQASGIRGMKSPDDSGDVSSDHADRVEEDITTVQDWDPLHSTSQDSLTEKESGRLDLNQALEMEIVAQSASQDALTRVEEGDGVLRTRSSATATSHHAPHLLSGFKSALPPSRPWNNDTSLHLLTQRKLGYSDSETASHRKFLSCVFASLINRGHKKRMTLEIGGHYYPSLLITLDHPLKILLLVHLLRVRSGFTILGRWYG